MNEFILIGGTQVCNYFGLQSNALRLYPLWLSCIFTSYVNYQMGHVLINLLLHLKRYSV